MGRKMLQKTDAEKLEQKRKWAQSHNAARRVKYEQDKEYRERAKASQRAGYRERTQPDYFDCRHNIPSLSTFGETRLVEGKRPMMTFTYEEATRAFGKKDLQIVRDWVKKGQIPEPTERAEVRKETSRRKYTLSMAVFTLSQMKALMNVLGPFQKGRRHFRVTDTEIIGHLHSAFEEAS